MFIYKITGFMFKTKEGEPFAAFEAVAIAEDQDFAVADVAETVWSGADWYDEDTEAFEVTKLGVVSADVGVNVEEGVQILRMT